MVKRKLPDAFIERLADSLHLDVGIGDSDETAAFERAVGTLPDGALKAALAEDTEASLRSFSSALKMKRRKASVGKGPPIPLGIYTTADALAGELRSRNPSGNASENDQGDHIQQLRTWAGLPGKMGPLALADLVRAMERVAYHASLSLTEHIAAAAPGPARRGAALDLLVPLSALLQLSGLHTTSARLYAAFLGGEGGAAQPQQPSDGLGNEGFMASILASYTAALFLSGGGRETVRAWRGLRRNCEGGDDVAAVDDDAEDAGALLVHALEVMSARMAATAGGSVVALDFLHCLGRLCVGWTPAAGSGGGSSIAEVLGSVDSLSPLRKELLRPPVVRCLAVLCAHALGRVASGPAAGTGGDDASAEGSALVYLKRAYAVLLVEVLHSDAGSGGSGKGAASAGRLAPLPKRAAAAAQAFKVEGAPAATAALLSRVGRHSLPKPCRKLYDALVGGAGAKLGSGGGSGGSIATVLFSRGAAALPELGAIIAVLAASLGGGTAAAEYDGVGGGEALVDGDGDVLVEMSFSVDRVGDSTVLEPLQGLS